LRLAATGDSALTRRLYARLAPGRTLVVTRRVVRDNPYLVLVAPDVGAIAKLRSTRASVL
jgi:hypothetical protein